MNQAVYRIEHVETKDSVPHYALYEHNLLIARFTRLNFQEKLHFLGRGSGFVGSILRLLNSKFPYSLPAASRSRSEAIKEMGVDSMLNHLKSKGFRVYKKQKVSDMDMIKHLESLGYCVEGLVSDCFYSTIENDLASKVSL